MAVLPYVDRSSNVWKLKPILIDLTDVSEVQIRNEQDKSTTIAEQINALQLSAKQHQLEFNNDTSDWEEYTSVVRAKDYRASQLYSEASEAVM